MYEYRGPSQSDSVADEQIGLAAPCIRQADRDVDRDHAQRTVAAGVLYEIADFGRSVRAERFL